MRENTLKKKKKNKTNTHHFFFFSLKKDYYSNNSWKAASNRISSFCFWDLAYLRTTPNYSQTSAELFLQIKAKQSALAEFSQFLTGSTGALSATPVQRGAELSAAELTRRFVLPSVRRGARSAPEPVPGWRSAAAGAVQQERPPGCGEPPGNRTISPTGTTSPGLARKPTKCRFAVLYYRGWGECLFSSPVNGTEPRRAPEARSCIREMMGDESLSALWA